MVLLKSDRHTCFAVFLFLTTICFCLVIPPYFFNKIKNDIHESEVKSISTELTSNGIPFCQKSERMLKFKGKPNRVTP